MDDNEIRDWRDDAAAHAEQHLEAWPDVEAYVGGRAAQMWVADPTHSDIQTFDHDKAVQYWTAWAEQTDYTIDVTNMFLSVDGVAYEERWPGLWPTDTGWEVPGPKDPAGMGALETLWFEDGLAVRGDVWYPPEENELFGFGCFAVDGCPALQATVDHYLGAWTSRDPGMVSALYSDDAVFEDSLFGLDATGAGSIGELADIRFGATGDLDIEVLGLYAWTDGHFAPGPDWPDRGRLVGIAIHYQVTFENDGAQRSLESLTTLELGTLTERQIEADPDGLVHVERVYHEPSSLLANFSS
jgi:hypothetical protein